MPEWRYRGRTVTTEEIGFIRSLIAEHPTASRRRLSENLCEAWQWKQANGAPLDNNVVERALKKAILHRKNALFYKTMNGARVGDLFMSLIHTCELNKVSPFDYLTELLRHPAELTVRPAEWMPWNYRRDATVVAAQL